MLERTLAVGSAAFLISGLPTFFVLHRVGEVVLLAGVASSFARGLLERRRRRDESQLRRDRERAYAEAHPRRPS